MNAKRSAVLLTLFLSTTLVGLSGCKGGAVLVKVGGEKIRESDLDLLVRVNPRLKARLATPAGKQQVLENYVEQSLLYQESLKRGLERRPEVKEKLSLYEKIIVAQALLDDELDHKVKEYYENHRDEFERVKASHILIRTVTTEEGKKKSAPKRSEAAALGIIDTIKQKLAKGEDFAALAKQFSEDERTNKKDGELGYIRVGDSRLERWGWLPLAEKAFLLKTGEVSEPIKTKDGFHLVKVVEEKQVQPFEEAEAAIRFRIQADIRTGLLNDLKKKYKVTFAENKGETPQAPPAGTSENPTPSAVAPGAPGTPPTPPPAPGIPPATPAAPQPAAPPQPAAAPAPAAQPPH